MCLAAFLENMSETHFIKMLITGDMQPRIKAECLSILFKSLSTYFMLTKGLDLLAYSLSQLLYSIMLLTLYPLLASNSDQSGLIKLRPMPGSGNNKAKKDRLMIERILCWVSKEKLGAQYINKDHMIFLQDFSLTTVLKFFLTEGEKLLIIGTAAFDSAV